MLMMKLNYLACPARPKQPANTMKTAVTILLALFAAGRVILAADSFPAITTTDGKTYDHITAQRADPDGLYIEYTPAGNGIGTAKVKFARLSADLQKQFGYDADAAKQYESEACKAALAFQAWAERQDAAFQRARAEAASREPQKQVVLVEQIPAADEPATTFYGGGLPYSRTVYGRPARFNSWTGTTFHGLVPEGQLFTPLGFNPAKTQFLPAAPRTGANFGRFSARLR
jgi:hypothetical protein